MKVIWPFFSSSVADVALMARSLHERAENILYKDNDSLESAVKVIWPVDSLVERRSNGDGHHG